MFVLLLLITKTLKIIPNWRLLTLVCSQELYITGTRIVIDCKEARYRNKILKIKNTFQLNNITE